MSRHFAKEHIQKPKKHRKICSTSLLTRQMQTWSVELYAVFWLHRLSAPPTPVLFKGQLSFLFFSCGILVWLCSKGNRDLTEWSWGCFFLCNFWNSFRRIGINCSLNVCWNSPLMLSHPGLLFVENFFHYWFDFITENWSVVIFYFSWFSLGRFYIPRNLFISSRLSFLLAYNCS